MSGKPENAPTRPLPRGPHKLSREEVQQSQRDRLLLAMADAVAEKGYANTAVADVLERAGVSRATFYRLFTDKDDCFRAAYESAAALIGASMAGALATDPSPRGSTSSVAPLDRLEQVLTVYLSLLAGAPALARTFLVEVYAAGPVAIEQRHASLELFVDLVASIFADEPGPFGDRPDQRFAVEILVGGVSSMVTHLVGTGQTDRLGELKEPLMQLAVTLSGGSTATK